MAAHRNRLRVRVRSFVDGHVLRFVSESEARAMIAENADGSEMLGEDGKPVEAIAKRISLKKHDLEIKLLAPLRRERTSPCTLTCSDADKNSIVHIGARISAKDSIRALEAAAAKVNAWPSIHDSRAPVVSAGTVYGVFCPFPPMDSTRIVTFA
jgi:hypothetical protein